MTRRSDRSFYALLGASLLPLTAVVFGLARAAHDVGAALADAPSPVNGLCGQGLVYNIDPAAHLASVVLAVAAAMVLVLGALAGAATHVRTAHTLNSKGLETRTPARLKRLAAMAGVRRIRVIASSQPVAFTVGYFLPLVVVSDALVRALDERELEALLRHEWQHVSRRDPLRMLIVTVILRGFLFAPALSRWADSFVTAKEIEADEAVIRAMGSRAPLVSALLAAGTLEARGASAGFADAWSARVDALEGRDVIAAEFGWRAMLSTGFALLAVGAGLFVIVTGMVDAHALHICG